MSAAPIRLLIVDDHPIVRDGLSGLFADEPGIEVVGTASGGRNALALVPALDPDVVLMDLRMPDLGGAETIRALRAAGQHTPVLVLTTFDTDADVVAAVEAGATGYLLKDASGEELLRAVRAAHRGETVLASSVAERLLGQVRDPKQATLSPREIDVLRLVARGTTNRDAARELFVSEATVKTHLVHIYAKLGVSDRAAAVAAGYESGLLGG